MDIDRNVIANALMSDFASSEIISFDAPLIVETIRETSQVPDGCAIYLVDKRYVLHISPKAFPEVAALEASAARAMNSALGAWGRYVLCSVGEGRIDQRSYCLTPLCVPLKAGRIMRLIERRRVGPEILTWLRGVTECGNDASEDFHEQCIAHCRALAALTGFSSDLNAAIGQAFARATTIPLRTVPMHGDLWMGNILRRSGQLAIIDWQGSVVQGYAIFDLIRFAESCRLSARRLRGELEAHASLLRVSVEDTSTYLIAALAHIHAHLEAFPMPQFIAMAENCHRIWRDAFDVVG